MLCPGLLDSKVFCQRETIVVRDAKQHWELCSYMELVSILVRKGVRQKKSTNNIWLTRPFFLKWPNSFSLYFLGTESLLWRSVSPRVILRLNYEGDRSGLESDPGSWGH